MPVIVFLKMTCMDSQLLFVWFKTRLKNSEGAIKIMRNFSFLLHKIGIINSILWDCVNIR